MDADAKVVWRRVLRDMRHTGVIRAADADVLRCYCEAVSRYAAAARLYAPDRAPDRGRDGEPRQEPAPPGRPRQRRRGPPVRPRARPLAVGPGRPADRPGARARRPHRRHRAPAAASGGRRCGLSRGPRCPVRRPPLRRVLRALHPPHQGPLGRPAPRLRALAARVLVGGPRVRSRDRPPHLQRGRPRHPAQEHEVHDGQRRRAVHARRRRRARARGLRRRGRPQPGRHRPGPGPEHGPAQPAPARPARPAPLRHRVPAQRRGHALPQSSDAALQHGLNPSANIVDELHAHKSAELYTALTTGTGAREQPFTLWITTAGVAGEGILAELFESMFSGSGELEDRGSLLIYRDRVNGTLIYWYGAPRDADIEDPAVWYAANPVSWLHDGKYLGAQFARLRARGALLEWRRYHLNQFVGFEDAWLRDGAWRATDGRPAAQRGLPIGVGIDRSPGGEHARDRGRAAPRGPGRGEGAGVRARVGDRDGQHRGDARPPPRAARRVPAAAGPRRADEAGAAGARLRVRPPGVRRVGRDARPRRAEHGRGPDDRGGHGPALDPRLRAHHDRAPRPRGRPDPRRARRQHDRGPDRPGHEGHPQSSTARPAPTSPPWRWSGRSRWRCSSRPRRRSPACIGSFR